MATKQTEANKRWQEKNKEKTRYLRNRSYCRSFLKNDATPEDIEEAQALIQERLKFLTAKEN
ncbi:MAG: hypothetical protein R3Y29_04330 [bacterium]